jgi:hypothetical protein
VELTLLRSCDRMLTRNPRQRQLTPKVTVFGLAHKYLPSELVAELRLPNVNSEKSIKENEKIKGKETKRQQTKANKKESMIAKYHGVH